MKLIRPIVFVDLETTGLDAKNDRIVEISMVQIENCTCGCHAFPGITHIQSCCEGGYTKHTLLTLLINPGIPIPESASAIHGITDEKVLDKPKFSDVAQQIYDSLLGCDVAGFNSNSFDLKMLAAEFERVGIYWDHRQHNLIDVGNLFKHFQPRTLSAAFLNYIGVPMSDAHSAEADAHATAGVFICMLHMHQEMPETIEEISLLSNFGKQMLDLSGKFSYDDEGDIVFTFGKHRNVKAKTQLPYLEWMLNKGDFSNDTKDICEQVLIAQRQLRNKNENK